MHKIKAENSLKTILYFSMFGMVDFSVSWNEYTTTQRCIYTQNVKYDTLIGMLVIERRNIMFEVPRK